MNILEEPILRRRVGKNDDRGSGDQRDARIINGRVKKAKPCQKQSTHMGEKWLSAKANSSELHHTKCEATIEAARQLRETFTARLDRPAGEKSSR
jgi:hypothetical protein